MGDGSVRWIVDDIRDGLVCGGIGLEYVLRAGRVKANGALLQRSSYPRLFAWVEANKGTVSTTETDWQQDFNKYQFTLGDGSTTFRVPDLRGKWLQAAESIGLLAAGLPNILGSARVAWSSLGMTVSGAMTTSGIPNPAGGRGANTGDAYNDVYLGINANLSSSIYGNSQTVQPPSIQLIAQIKY